QLRAAVDQPAQCVGILDVIASEHVNVGLRAGRLERGLVGTRQLGPLPEVDDGGELRSALPPSRVVVELRDLVQSELFVVVRPDPFGGVYRAPLERRVDIAARDLLADYAELGEHHAAQAADPELEALQVRDALDL